MTSVEKDITLLPVVAEGRRLEELQVVRFQGKIYMQFGPGRPVYHMVGVRISYGVDQDVGRLRVRIDGRAK